MSSRRCKSEENQTIGFIIRRGQILHCSWGTIVGLLETTAISGCGLKKPKKIISWLID